MWKTEVGASYYCFEHFIIESGRGSGWHQFGGLSSPVVSWFNAYYRPGQLTTGLDIWVEEQQFSNDNRAFKGRLRLNAPPRTVVVIVNMQFGHNYLVLWDGGCVKHIEINPGSFQIEIPFDSQVGQLEIALDS